MLWEWRRQRRNLGNRGRIDEEEDSALKASSNHLFSFLSGEFWPCVEAEGGEARAEEVAGVGGGHLNRKLTRDGRKSKRTRGQEHPQQLYP